MVILVQSLTCGVLTWRASLQSAELTHCVCAPRSHKAFHANCSSSAWVKKARSRFEQPSVRLVQSRFVKYFTKTFVTPFITPHRGYCDDLFFLLANNLLMNSWLYGALWTNHSRFSLFTLAPSLFEFWSCWLTASLFYYVSLQSSLWNVQPVETTRLSQGYLLKFFSRHWFNSWIPSLFIWIIYLVFFYFQENKSFMYVCAYAN